MDGNLPLEELHQLRLFLQHSLNDPNGSFLFSSNDSDFESETLPEKQFNRNTEIALIMMYCILITIGVVGNSLVCIAVIRKPQMRTARNVFIVNLAISDLTLCLFTMPFSLVEILLSPNWPLGEILCKLIPAIQATTIFVSTISITAIALDRYQVIVYPTKENMKKVGSIVILFSIWAISFLMATPLFIFRKLKHIGLKDFMTFDLNHSVPHDIMHKEYCLEEWPMNHGRGIYSLAAMMFQYCLPIIVVSVAYARICIKLKYRIINQVNSPHQQRKKEIEEKRQRKTNMLLIAIAMLFAVSWLPLNFLNILGDFKTDLFNDIHKFSLIFACCHMLGMSSACSNPLLYGWLNEKFRKEFNEIFKVCFGNCNSKCCRRHRKNQEPIPVVMYTKANCNYMSETQDGSGIITQTVTTTIK